MPHPHFWGIDLGGTKTEGVVIPADAPNKPLCRLRIPTEREKGYDHILHQIRSLLGQMETQAGLQAQVVGIGTPGTLDPGTQRMKNCNTVVLNGRPLHTDLENILQRPVRLANDANCFALAETRLGAVPRQAPDARMVFGVIMGSGVGGGIVFDGKLWGGPHGIAGEWGHNFLDKSGGECYCGRTGCVETVISGKALENFYRQQSGTALPLPDILARTQSDYMAAATQQRLYKFFGKAIAHIINILDPDAIILGGGVGNIPGLYTEGVRKARAYVFNPEIRTRFLAPALGDSAGVFGAAMLGENHTISTNA